MLGCVALNLTVLTPVSGKGEPTGEDTMMALVPLGWYADVAGEQALDLRVAQAQLRAYSAQAATSMGETLHHANWAITGDVAEVAKLGNIHDCATCRASTDQAVAFLRDNPGREVAIARLFWA